MEQGNHKPPRGMAADLSGLQHAREVMRAVEQRTKVHRDAPTDKPDDVLERLLANQTVYAAMRELIP